MLKSKFQAAATTLGIAATILATFTLLNAQSATSTATSTETQTPKPNREENIQKLIDEGKITQEQVDSCQAMQQGLHEQRYDQLVADGVLTQEQADALKDLPKGQFMQKSDREEMETKLAEKLGISADEITDGKGIFSLVKDGTITKEQLQAAQQEIRNEQLDQAVSDGTLTQLQADALKALEANKEGKMGFGMRGGGGWGHKGGFDF